MPPVIAEDQEEEAQTAGALVAVATSLVPETTSPARDDEPETTEDLILRLPKKWMQRYMRELWECGSVAEARDAVGSISHSSVYRAIAECPAFAALHQDALAARHDRVDGHVYRGATQGDEVPLVSQGAIVGSYKKRDTKAGELWYRRHGLLAADKATVTHQGHVTTPDSDLPAQLLKVAEMLFGGSEPKVIEGKVVEPDKG